MAELLHPTPYADVNNALNDFHQSISVLLENQFVGMYVIGSLAIGDFDIEHSDIDFVVVTNTDIEDNIFQALQEIHTRFAESSSAWAKKIEAVYIPKIALKADFSTIEHYPQIEKGTSLFKAPLEDGWVFQCYTLREHSLVVAGQNPRTLSIETNPQTMRDAVAKISGLWLEQAQTDTSWLDWVRQRENQKFVILTLCRLLYSLTAGGVASKPSAAEWGKKHLGQRWRDLIESAIAQHPQQDEISPGELDDTIAFIRYTLEYSQRESDAPPS